VFFAIGRLASSNLVARLDAMTLVSKKNGDLDHGRHLVWVQPITM
jgi:hypothetical protein